MTQNYCQVLESIRAHAEQVGRDPSAITLVAVTKHHPLEEIQELHDAGARAFGESRVQEAVPKLEQASFSADWHFIGTLQKNKLNKVLGRFALIHSVDSQELAEAISKRADRKEPLLLQVNTSGEKAKHGLSPEEWEQAWTRLLDLPHLDVQGLMTMAPHTDDDAVIRRCFAALRQFRDHLETKYSVPLPHLSMGMSHDYTIAIEEGATLLRIGSALFQ